MRHSQAVPRGRVQLPCLTWRNAGGRGRTPDELEQLEGGMKRRSFAPARGVSNIELFYDLIFVYCISVLTSTMHHVNGDFVDFAQWLSFTFSYLVVLQVWFFTTFLMNRYGDHSAGDNVCLFVNMFLLYFLANGISAGWKNSIFTFNIAWALILANLVVHWVLKRHRYDNLDADDKAIMDRTATVLVIEFVLVVAAIFIPAEASVWLSWIALLFGGIVFFHSKTYDRKPARFAHLVERCSLLTIIAFGETIVAIAVYMSGSADIWFSILVFALVVGMFLIYIYERDNMTDHHKDTNGMVYLTITGWIILVIGNITVGLEYMQMQEIALGPKSAYLAAGLVLYLSTSFLLGFFNKAEYTYSAAYIAGRLGTCAFIVVVALVTNFNPLVSLVCSTLAVYFALWHEWLLYSNRSRIVAFGKSLGYTLEDMEDAGMTFKTAEGRRAIAGAVHAAREEQERP